MRTKLLLATAAVGAFLALAPAIAADNPGESACSVTSTVDLGTSSISVTTDDCDAEARYENASLLDRIRILLGGIAPHDPGPGAGPTSEATVPVPPPAASAGRDAPESRPAADGLRCEVSVRPAQPRASRPVSEFLARELPKIADVPQPAHDVGILLASDRAATVSGTATVTSEGSNRLTASQGIGNPIRIEPGRKEWVYVLTTYVAPGMVLEGSFEGRDGTVRCEAAVGRPDSRRR